MAIERNQKIFHKKELLHHSIIRRGTVLNVDGETALVSFGTSRERIPVRELQPQEKLDRIKRQQGLR